MNSFSTIGIFSKREGKAVEATLRTLHQFLTERGVKILASRAPAKILQLTETDEHQIAQHRNPIRLRE